MHSACVTPFSTDELLQQTHWLQRLARSLVADDALASDLVQDTVASALAQRPRGLRDLRAWLATVLQRHAARTRRRERVRPAIERLAARDEALPATDDAVAQAMLHRDLVDAVLALGEPYRTAVLLRYLRDLPIAEVARRTQAPLATARSRVQRGLALLRQRLDRTHGSRAAWVTLLGPTPLATTTVATASLLMHSKTIASVLAAGLALVTAVWWSTLPQTPTAPPRVADALADAAAQVGKAPIAADAAERARADTGASPVADASPRAVAIGTLLDEETHTPLADVAVAWHALRGLAAAPSATARTDASGHFELTCEAASPAANFGVLLQPNDHAWLVRPLPSVTAATPMRFDLGTILVPPGTSVAGRVVDCSGQPVAAAALLFYDTLFFTQGGRTVTLAHPVALGASAVDGTFAPHARLVPEQDAVLVAASPRGLGWISLPGLARRRTELRDVTITLAEACELTVHVTTPDGHALADAAVLAEPRFAPLGADDLRPLQLERVAALVAVFTATTDAHGDARLPALPLGRADGNLVLPRAPDGALLGNYRLTVHKPGFVPGTIACTLTIGPRTETVVLAPPRTITLTGTVRSTDQRPLAGATITVDATTTATTDAQGSFTLVAAAERDQLQITARAADHASETRAFDLAADRDRAEIAFVLAPCAPLHGVVVDQDGQPVAGAMVFVEHDSHGVATDAQGRFVVPEQPRGRSLELTVQAPEPASDWAPLPELAVTTADAPITLRLQRLPTGDCAITVELLDADGAPLECKRVRLLRAGEQLHHSTTAIGRVHAKHLGPGPWRLAIDTLRGPSIVADISIPVGAREHAITLRQARGASLEVELVTEPRDLALPDELTIAAGRDNAGRFAGAAADDRVLRLDPARARTFTITDLDPTRVVHVYVNGTRSELTGELHVPAGALPPRAQLVLRASGRLVLTADAPWPQHGLLLWLRRPGTEWDQPNRIGGIEGRTKLFPWNTAPGDWEWRVDALSSGSAQPPARWEGRVTVPAGGTADARLDAATRR